MARNEFAATFTSSDVGRSARTQGVPNAITGSYTSLRIFALRAHRDQAVPGAGAVDRAQPAHKPETQPAQPQSARRVPGVKKNSDFIW